VRELTRWAGILPAMFGTALFYLFTGWLRAKRAENNQGECGKPPTLKRGPYRHWEESAADYFDATLQWCDTHEEWFGPEECLGCRAMWEERWTIAQADDDGLEWPSQAEIAHFEATESDGWYRDLVKRAEFPSDPHSDWRDGE